MRYALSPFMSLTFVRQNTASVCAPASSETSGSRRTNHENLVTVLPPAVRLASTSLSQLINIKVEDISETSVVIPEHTSSHLRAQ